jgi:hypothetical protein
MGKTLFRRNLFLFFGIFFCLTFSFSVSSFAAYAADSTAQIIIIDPCAGNADCKEGYFCSRAIAYCNGPGVCVQKPSACITLYDPVCGCDGVTCGNSCVEI